MSGSKVMTMREAVARFIPDGASVCANTAIEALIPFAVGHELIRQRRRDLTLIGPISDMALRSAHRGRLPPPRGSAT